MIYFYITILLMFIISSLVIFFRRIELSVRDKIFIKWGLWFFIFFLITSLLLLLGSIKYSKFSISWPLLSNNSDQARVLYETRSILGVAETIIVASIAFFVPLLLFIWNNTLDFITKQYEKITSMKKLQNLGEEQKDKISAEINEIKELSSNLKYLGDITRAPFYLCNGYAFILLIACVIINFDPTFSINAYYEAILLKVCSIHLFIWYATFLLIFLTAIQSERRKHSHLERLIELYSS